MAETSIRFVTPNEDLLRRVEETEVDDPLAGADYISRIVHGDYLYAPLQPNSENRFTPETIDQNRTTNCYGFTVILSELLSLREIPHYVAFANTHAFVIATDQEKARLIDAQAPYLNASIDYRDSDEFDSARLSVATIGGHAALKLFSNDLLAAAGNYAGDDRIRRHEWLSFAPDDPASRFRSDDQRELDHTLMTTIVEPETGRQMLNNLAIFMQSYCCDLDLAHKSVVAMREIFPEVDRRNIAGGWLPVETYLRRMSGREMSAFLIGVEALSQSFTNVSSDISLAVWGADRVRRAGSRTGDADLVEKSIEMYDQVLIDQEERTDFVDKRRAKAERILCGLAKN